MMLGYNSIIVNCVARDTCIMAAVRQWNLICLPVLSPLKYWDIKNHEEACKVATTLELNNFQTLEGTNEQTKQFEKLNWLGLSQENRSIFRLSKRRNLTQGIGGIGDGRTEKKNTGQWGNSEVGSIKKLLSFLRRGEHWNQGGICKVRVDGNVC